MRSMPQEFRAVEAATGMEFGPPFRASGLEDVERVCSEAAAAFDVYRATGADERAAFLEAMGEEIEALGDRLIETAARETGLPFARLEGEHSRTVGQIAMFAQVVRDGGWRGLRIDPAEPARRPAPRADLRLRMVPLGPVAVFGASNFPLAFSTAGGDTVSALAAGCPVVVKGHPAHPGTDEMVAGAIAKAVERRGMPIGTFGHVRGPGTALGSALVADRRIAAVGFTGSRRGGLAIVEVARARDVPIPVYAEMSSINPVVLMPAALDSRGSELGESFVSSLTLGAGQFCTNPGLLLAVESSGLRRFEETAATALSLHEPQPMLTGDIRSAFAQGRAALDANPAVDQLAVGIEGDGVSRETASLFVTDAQAFMDDPSMAEEVFGACSLLVRCRDLGQLRTILEELEGQLTASIQLDAADEAAAAPLVGVLERRAGRVLANGWPTGVEVGHAMVHGGPYPATADGRSTSVGSLAIERFLRPVCYQDLPASLLPPELRDGATDFRQLGPALA